VQINPVLVASYRVVQHRVVYVLGRRGRWWTRRRVHDEFHLAVWAHSDVPALNQPAAGFRVKEPTTGDGNTTFGHLILERERVEDCRRGLRVDFQRFRQDFTAGH
jgi:hypothetical protein